MQVRLAGTGDVAAVARLIAAFRDWEGYSGPDDATIERTVARLVGDPQTEFLLAGDPPQGVAQVRYRLSVWTGVEDAWLEDVYVEEPARGQGLGRALVQAAIDRAGARGCARIELDTGESNPAKRLYEALGFSRKGGDAVYMQKRLPG